ncbi:MAG: hypothetical protein H8D23_40895 [Candidatus Brocadiales bacterium]|nr:hypothetical protein [Candidatus Brocadiales bacterium]
MNNNKEKKLYDKIAKVVSEVVSDACNNPAVFVSEMDIHVLIMKALMEIKCLNRRYDTSCTLGMNNMGAVSGKKYKTMLVHKEYGNERGRNERSDIVIFDKKDVKLIDDPLNLKSEGKYLEPKYVFEFGTEKSAGTNKNYKEHLEGDFNKLSKIKNTGFLIHIQRIYVKSRSGTKRYKDNRNKIEAYVKSTVEIWNSFKVKSWANRIKVLIFFVDLGGEKRVVSKKVRMFNPYPNPKRKNDANCIPVNQVDIKEIIKEFLKEDSEYNQDIERIKAVCSAKRKQV